MFLGFMCAVSSAADLTLVAVDPTTIGPQGTVQIEAFVANISPDLLRSYQVTIEILPQPGATGGLGLVDPVTPDPNNTSIFVDTSRPDWVLAGGGSSFAFADVTGLAVAATLISGNVSPAGPSYLGTFILRASGNALGDFLIDFKLVDPNNPLARPTNLLSEDGTTLAFTTTPLTINVVDQVVNDSCVGALSISDGLTPFTTRNATTDGPPLDPSCDGGNGLSFEQDIWFEYTASCNGVATMSTCNAADFDTRLAIYGGTLATCSCPIDNSTLLACNDDGVACANGTSEVAFPVNAGRCYTVRLGGLGLAEGLGTLRVSCAPDLCADASPLTVPATVTSSTANTPINDGIGPNCGLGPVDSSGVWYLVPGNGGPITASIGSDAGFDSRLTIYSGSCAALTCVGEADVPGSGGESVSWCSTVGTDYLVLVHGVGGASGTFTLNVSGSNCDDFNACTADSCSAGACVNDVNFDDTTFCCVPVSGALSAISDGNPCTVDTCNVTTGAVSHAAGPDGPNEACEDGFACTLDSCTSGACTSADINAIACLIDSECPGGNPCVSGFCECIGVTLELVAEPGALSPDACYDTTVPLTVNVELGPRNVQFISGDDIVGVQFFLEYDATTLDFLNIRPGQTSDPTSPFSFELGREIDETAGTIDYIVSVAIGGVPTRSPARTAVVTFQPLAECTSFVRFRAAGPNGEPNLVAGAGGIELFPIGFDLPPLLIDANAPVLATCPGNITANSDPGQLSAVVTFVEPTSTDSCDPGFLAASCDPPSGSAFPVGTTLVTCSSSDSCGLQDTCTFNVSVVPSTLTVDVQLSATVSPTSFERCVTFELLDCNGPAGAERAIVSQTLTFVGGIASVVNMPIPGGDWECLAVRDELHTLRSTAPDLTTLDGSHFTASLLGPRASGGHWLVGGDLNDDGRIDILDFAVFFPQYLTLSARNTPCTFAGLHANINGDNVVDLLDLVFVSGNSLQVNETVCCPAGGGGAAVGEPIRSITIQELRARGLGHLTVADVNRDGVVDVEDIKATLRGEIPGGSSPRDVSTDKTTRSRPARGLRD